MDIARDFAEGLKIIELCMDEVLPDAKTAMTSFLNLALQYPDIANLPVRIKSSRQDLVEAALKCIQGKSLVDFIGLKEGDADFDRLKELVRSYGALLTTVI